ncbi:MAG: sarcosine oxidase subunit gamma [Albidovulum sp.]|nr:sarcosine oxidase subunit gamma [Albidovulum sp.]
MPYDASLKTLELQALFDIKGRKEDIRLYLSDLASSFPESPNTFNYQVSHTVYYLGPDHWLMRANLKREAELLAAMRPDSAPDDISIVLVSDMLAFFEISGSQAEDIMAIITSLDIHPSSFPANRATFTEASGIKALVSRKADGSRGFELAFDRSYRDMISNCLLRILS